MIILNDFQLKIIQIIREQSDLFYNCTGVKPNAILLGEKQCNVLGVKTNTALEGWLVIQIDQESAIIPALTNNACGGK